MGYRGTRAGRHVVRSISQIVSNPMHRPHSASMGVNTDNLTLITPAESIPSVSTIPVQISSPQDRVIHQPKADGVNMNNLAKIISAKKYFANVAILNARSVCNKALDLNEYVMENDIDFFCITETWLSSSNRHAPTIASLTPAGYKFHHVPRPSSTGGGVGCLYKEGIRVSQVPTPELKTFEVLHQKFQHRSTQYRLLTVYRPPPSRKNNTPFSVFLDEFSSLLEEIILAKGKLMIVGDFNIHMDSKTNPNTKKFNSLLESFGLVQHVEETTHKNGHTIDLVITKSHEFPFSGLTVTQPLISDHHCISLELKTVKPKYPRREISYRPMRDLDTENFKSDLTSALENIDTNSGTVSDLVEKYNCLLEKTLDTHAPLKTRTITVRPKQPWYDESVDEARKIKRKAEKMWRKTGLTVHKEIYISKKKALTEVIKSAKTNFYRNRLDNNPGQKELFNCVNELLNKTKTTSLPKHTSKTDLANEMSDYFSDKIKKIRNHLEIIQNNQSNNVLPDVEIKESDTYLYVLQPASEEEVRKTIMSSSSTTCALDPLPTPLTKDCLDVLLPTITAIINRSLREADVPESFKLAIIIPLLKKQTLDPDILKNYRPISNLPFLSKILERVVASRLNSHTRDHPNSEKFQSAYKQYHSTESALLRIHNDILTSIDNQNCVALLLLDLSAAFDTVDHALLLQRLETRFGIKGQALKWVMSYFENRKQIVTIDGENSKETVLTCNVPQGSVLGPKFFLDYESPLGDIIRSHGLSAHFYADDTQLYLSFNPNHSASAMERLENCVSDIRNWMASNFLKLNDDKTELIFLGTSEKSFLEVCRYWGL